MVTRSRLALPPFVLVTGNEGKRREVERLLGREVGHRAIELPEIQSLDLRQVLEAKADEAWCRLERPLVVDDTALGLEALGGFPGPLVRWLLESVGPAGIARIASALGDTQATAACALLYTDGERRVFAQATVPGRIVSVPRGDRGFGWDPIFAPDGQDSTYGELADGLKDEIGHRGKAWRALAERLAAAGLRP